MDISYAKENDNKITNNNYGNSNNYSYSCYIISNTIYVATKNGMDANIEGVKALYSYSEFTSALMRDYAISVVFTILGAGAVTEQ